ncbi:MAG: hypothetical protein CSA29_05730 [Desulfobacterales bacterium]|nr:MAG: hypothetical protein CSA29_05730 [Desulfobacterales bacterium]
MKQNIRFEKDVNKGRITLTELSEVDPGVVQPLIEEAYDLEVVAAASKQGLEAFIEALRRRSFFPTRDLCEKLFDHTTEFFTDPDAEKIVVEYNDTEAFPGQEEFQLEEDDVELDALLEEDGDTKEDEMKEIDSDDDRPTFTPDDTSEHEN